ncbi:MAG: hypothetical protein K0R57_835 [Paenibacillaceae bacterium]|jgi:hypothetical protein|nr:hypothetical protein [Paenibacillaceae bacterium]
MKRKAIALASALALSAMLSVPAFADSTNGMGARGIDGMAPMASSAPDSGFLNNNGDGMGTGVFSSPSATYSNTTGVGNYGVNGTNDYTGTGTGTYNAYATADDDAMDWGWLGLLGLVGLAGLMGRNRERDRIK